MVGAQVSPSIRRACVSSVLSVLSVWCFSAALVTAGNPLTGADGQWAAAADCKLTILGGEKDRLQQASMSCTGTVKPVVRLNATLLRGFEDMFTGVRLTDSCPTELTRNVQCLMTICGGSLVLRDSSVSMVRGSALHGLVCVAHISRLEVYNSRFTDNKVRPLMIGDQANVMLHGTNVSHNAVRRYTSGGGLWVEGNAHVTLTDGSRVEGNMVVGGGGGGLFVRGNAYVVVGGGSSIRSNNATGTGGGGGLLAHYNASVSIIGGSIVQGNIAHWGGGLQAAGHASVSITGGCSVHGNLAIGSGGGVAVGMPSFLGGGVAVDVGAHVAIINSSVHDNKAIWGGGGVFAGVASTVAITNSVVQENTSPTYGGGVLAEGDSKVSITNSTLYNNTAARLGGGVCAFFNATLVLANASRIHSNTARAGGGIYAVGDPTMVLANPSGIHSNRASNGSGGGLNVSGGVVLTISGGCSITNNSCTGGVGGGISVGMDVDLFKFGGMGRLEGNAASGGRGNDSTRVTISDSIIANNTSHRAAGGGLAVVSQCVVKLINGTKVLGNRAINSSGGAVVLMGAALLDADNTVLFANNSVPRGFVGSTIVAFDSSNLSLPSHGSLTKCSNGVYLGRTPCGKGELLQHDVCVCCPSHTFSFGNTSCTQCPPNAACPGASIVEPLDGFWASAPTSIQMHRCPLFKTSCDYVNQTHMCKPGYKGPLCGDCQLPEYGMLTPMRCGNCMPPSTQLGLYLLVSFMIVIFVDLTVHFTWQDNLRGDRAILITDFIKVLVLFLQYMVIIGSVSVPWPLFDVQLWLQAIGIMVTIGSGQAMSLDCWLWSYNRKSKLPVALQRQLVYFLAPLCTLLVVMAVQSLVWVVQCWVVPLIWKPKEGAVVRKPFLLLRKLPVTVLVLLFYAFPTLVRASLSFFACLVIDKPLSAMSSVPVGATAPLSHRWGYWVSSIEQQCFAGYHLGWSMGLGLPSVLLWCLIVPVAMGVGLYLCRGRADTDSFREHFGFLYRTYKPECMWWEAVWAARTVVLTLISVFAFPMQRYFSVLSLLLIFLASAALQIMFQPYESPILHRMHLVSTSCLAATTLGALAMFAYDIQESTAYALRIAITVLVFVVNLAFVGWCCVKLVPSLREGVVKHWPKVKAWLMGAVARVLGCIGLSPGRKGRHGRRGTPGGCWGV